MCSQLFTLLLLALSLTLASCLEPKQTTTYIDSSAPSEEIYGYPKYNQVYLDTKSLQGLVVDNEKIAAKIKNLSKWLKEVLKRLDGVDTRLTSQAAESKDVSNGLKEVVQRVDGLENRLTSHEKATNILYQQKETVFTLITDSKKNWYEAFVDCRRRGLDLASIENEKEYQNIYSKIKSIDDTKRNMSFWLSATDLIHEHTYVWMSTGQNVGFTKWAPGEPNKHSTKGEHCVELQYQRYHKMNDVNCAFTKNYICESRNNENSLMSERRNKVFTVFDGTKLSWYEALIDCKRQGLRLATVESQEEQDEVVKSIKMQDLPISKKAFFWLSGSDLGKRNDYVWMTSGLPLNYTAWYSTKDYKEPNHAIHNRETEHCLSLRGDHGHKWNDAICSRKHYYICDNQA